MSGMERSILKPGTKRTICYYCHPYASFERGSNENANRMIRRFIPKGSDIGKYTKKQIRKLENWINNYPRSIFGGMSSNQYRASLGIFLKRYFPPLKQALPVYFPCLFIHNVQNKKCAAL